jgi:hypothetical protein
LFKIYEGWLMWKDKHLNRFHCYMSVCGLISRMYLKLVKLQRDSCHGRYKEETLSRTNRDQFPCLHFLHSIMKLIIGYRMSEWNPE